MKKRLFTLLLTLSIAASFLTGCGSKFHATNLVDGKEPKNFLKITALSENDTIVATDFAIRLFQQAKNGEENALLSPLSVLPALSMTANGAKEETLAQMEHTFRMPMNTFILTSTVYRRQTIANFILPIPFGSGMPRTFL